MCHNLTKMIKWGCESQQMGASYHERTVGAGMEGLWMWLCPFIPLQRTPMQHSPVLGCTRLLVVVTPVQPHHGLKSPSCLLSTHSIPSRANTRSQHGSR